jgi:hypothetical protein
MAAETVSKNKCSCLPLHPCLVGLQTNLRDGLPVSGKPPMRSDDDVLSTFLHLQRLNVYASVVLIVLLLIEKIMRP